MQNTLVDRAEIYARRVHEGQYLKNIAREPYARHLQGVAELVTQAGGTKEEIATAWLHDSIEDRGVKENEIEREFGTKVAALVGELSDAPKSFQLPIVERKAKQLQCILNKSESARKIKLADQIWNVLFMLNDPPTDMNENEIYEYVQGGKNLIEACKDTSPILYQYYLQSLPEENKNTPQ